MSIFHSNLDVTFCHDLFWKRPFGVSFFCDYSVTEKLSKEIVESSSKKQFKLQSALGSGVQIVQECNHA